MTDVGAKNCKSEFAQLSPEKPWTAQTPVANFEPLVNRIEQHTQSDLFRRQGKYAANDEYYDLAKEVNKHNQADVKKTFDNAVTLEMHQQSGWPVQLIIEDKSAHLKETVHLSDISHRIIDDKVEYCGVSRLRKFSEQGESFRAYTFNGGSIEQTGALPVLKLENQK
jgi:hypothetical protein